MDPRRPGLSLTQEMDADTLAELTRQKQAKIDVNTEALDKALLEHEDLIAEFDALIGRLERGESSDDREFVGGATLEELRALRDKAYALLLGPAGPERDAGVEMTF